MVLAMLNTISSWMGDYMASCHMGQLSNTKLKASATSFIKVAGSN